MSKTNLLVTTERLAHHLTWLAKGANDDEVLTPDYFIQSVVAMILSTVQFTDVEETDLLNRLGLEWTHRPSGQRVIQKKHVPTKEDLKSVRRLLNRNPKYLQAAK